MATKTRTAARNRAGADAAGAASSILAQDDAGPGEPMTAMLALPAQQEAPEVAATDTGEIERAQITQIEDIPEVTEITEIVQTIDLIDPDESVALDHEMDDVDAIEDGVLDETVFATEEEPIELEPACIGPTLDEDIDTSLVLSIQFHLMSEHQIPTALHLDDDEAEAMHARLHVVTTCDHHISDRRMRPGRAIAVLMLHCHREHEASLLAIPAAPVPAAE